MSSWTSLPLTHPTPFSLILLELSSPRELLACRAVCRSWSSWFSASSSLWSKYLARQLATDRPEPGQVFAAYRRRKILEARSESEADSLRVCVMMWRARHEVCPPVSPDTMRLVNTLEMKVPVLGPPALFIRMKVNHPLVKKIIVELLSKYLTCICLNKQDVARNEDVKNFVSRQSWGPNGTQNWAFVDNLRNKDQEEEEEEGTKEQPELEGVVLEGEHRLEEALKLSLQPRTDKRKLEEEAGESSKDCKRRKKEKETDAEDCKEEEGAKDESEEEEAAEEEAEGKSLYSVDEGSKRHMFPSILDVLSIDHEVVRSLLIDRCEIHKHFIVPQFDQFIQHLSLFDTEDETTRVIGCDSDGKVVSINPALFNNVGDTIVGYIDSPFTLGDHGRLLTVWGGEDIRDKWPEFAKQLSNTTETQMRSTKKVPRRPEPRGPASSSAPASESDLLASLAARGISIVRK